VVICGPGFKLLSGAVVNEWFCGILQGSLDFDRFFGDMQSNKELNIRFKETAQSGTTSEY